MKIVKYYPKDNNISFIDCFNDENVRCLFHHYPYFHHIKIKDCHSYLEIDENKKTKYLKNYSNDVFCCSFEDVCKK